MGGLANGLAYGRARGAKAIVGGGQAAGGRGAVAIAEPAARVEAVAIVEAGAKVEPAAGAEAGAARAGLAAAAANGEGGPFVGVRFAQTIARPASSGSGAVTALGRFARRTGGINGSSRATGRVGGAREVAGPIIPRGLKVRLRGRSV